MFDDDRVVVYDDYFDEDAEGAYLKHVALNRVCAATVELLDPELIVLASDLVACSHAEYTPSWEYDDCDVHLSGVDVTFSVAPEEAIEIARVATRAERERPRPRYARTTARLLASAPRAA
jgi:hypothetical protein